MPATRPWDLTACVCTPQIREELREKRRALELEAKETFEDRVECSKPLRGVGIVGI